jgi:hypothetical protein
LVGDRARAEVTPAYVDPVVARGGAPGPASDVFGVAAAAFHALTGIAPWNAADPGGALAVAAAGELPDLALLAPEAPEELVRVVRRGLSLEPHQRGSAAAFALDLRHACRPEPVRLPVAGVPDGELGRTGWGPRTELTHQVPGNRPRAHAAPVQVGWLGRLCATLAGRVPAVGEQGLGRLLAGVFRRAAVVGGVLLAVAAGLAGAAWAGASWGGHPGDPVPAADTAHAPGQGTAAGRTGRKTAAPPSDRPVEPSDGATQASDDVPVAEPTTVPADEAGWTALLADLYARRATAFTTVDPQLLAEVYVPGSALLDRDTTALRELADAGQTLAGFAPQVRRVESVDREGEARAVLRLVDELPGYRVQPIDDGAESRRVPARGEAQVRIVLERTAAGWRIADARVEP